MPRIRYEFNPAECEFSAIRAQGAGGQNVNKVASAVQLRFPIHSSTLPPELKDRLIQWPDQRITQDGVIIIKGQEHRTQEQNRQDTLERLKELLEQVAYIPRTRKQTKPTRASREKRLNEKTQRSQIKQSRGKFLGEKS